VDALLEEGGRVVVGLGLDVLQQLESFAGPDVTGNDAFRPISRFWDRIARPEQLLQSLPEAIRVLTDQAQTGAVTLALPEDVQTEAYDYPAAFFEKRVHRIPRQAPAEEELAAAVALLREAKRPLIVAGGGVIYSEATAALAELAETCGIPVAETQAGKGALPWNHPWNVGPIGANGGLAANRLAAAADLVIAIGTRLADFPTASRTAFQDPDVRFLGLNLQPMDAVKLGAAPLVADARAGICALVPALRAVGHRTDDAYADRVRGLKMEWDVAVDGQRAVTGNGPLTEANAIGLVNDASRPQDVVVCAAGGLPGDLLKLWRPLDPKGYHLEYGYSCMGYEIAGGLGVKMAAPEREVYVMVGDGSYLMMHTEIVTSIQEGLKLTIVLLDNGGFGCIRGLQTSAGTPPFGNDLRFRDPSTNRLTGPTVPVDFVKNAESLGAVAFHAPDRAALERALAVAAAETRTVVIVVPIDPDARVPSYESWWDVPVAEVSAQPAVQAARAAYETAQEKQRFYG
jgi:3D-(3,5/4)-trihydroxycyclohexane-1,2-dione acylhydrolase (decyclizing)